MEDFYPRCEHCLKLVSPGEMDTLTSQKCTILKENEMYLICEYCIGAIECKGEGTGEIEYWNEWVSKKRMEKN
jgi:hypothetical protein